MPTVIDVIEEAARQIRAGTALSLGDVATLFPARLMNAAQLCWTARYGFRYGLNFAASLDDLAAALRGPPEWPEWPNVLPVKVVTVADTRPY